MYIRHRNLPVLLILVFAVLFNFQIAEGLTYNLVEHTEIGTKNWREMASSADGSKLIAVTGGEYIYTSNDYGKTWTARTAPGAREWNGAASSADGTKIATAQYGGHIWTSTDSGETWNWRVNAGIRTWHGLVSSATGEYLAAAVDVGYVYTSIDFGANWVVRSGMGNQWDRDITSSSDGTKLAIATDGNYVWTSSNSGANWTRRTSGPQASRDIVSSGDGDKLASVFYGGPIYTSTDAGANWTTRTDAGTRLWKQVDASLDGSIIVACVENGYLYKSEDSGASWTELTSLGSKYWLGVALSDDGSRLTAGEYGGYIYTTTDNLIVELVSSTYIDDEATTTPMQILVAGGITTGDYTLEIADLGTGTATSTSDFSLATTTITIPAGDYSSTTTISLSNLSITDDSDIESSETINFQIQNPSSYLSIADVDGNGTTISSTTYTITNNDDPNILVELSTSTISANENVATSSLPSLLVGGTLSLEDLSVDLSLSLGVGIDSDDYTIATTTITIPAGDYTSTTSISLADIVSIDNDDIDESNEIIEFSITNPSTFVSISDADGDSETTATTTYTILDNDTSGITISESTLSVTEGGASATFSVVLTSEPTEDVSISLNLSNSEIYFSTSTLIFTSLDWDTPQEIDVDAEDDAEDDDVDNSATISFTASSSDSNYDTFSLSDISVSITDNDTTVIQNTSTRKEGRRRQVFLPSQSTISGSNFQNYNTNQNTESDKTFTLRNLNLGTTGLDVKALQQFLNSHGFQLTSEGPGSPGNETQKFGFLTRTALIKFQLANAISPAIGFFGPITRGVINNLLNN